MQDGSVLYSYIRENVLCAKLSGYLEKNRRSLHLVYFEIF